MDFEGLVDNDVCNVGALLDDIDGYPAHVIHNAIVNSTNEVLLGYFDHPDHYAEARELLSNRLNYLLQMGGTTLDSDVVQQYCAVLIPLLEDVDAANRQNGHLVEEQNADAAQLQEINLRLEAAEGNFRSYLDQCQDVYNAIKIDHENNEWGLADYLINQLNQGGCNNVFVNWAMSIVGPFAQYGYVRPEERVRQHLLNLGIQV